MRVFVFGSNLEGVHGTGSALEAKLKHGAIQGVGRGPMGTSYAIPTKFSPKKGDSLSLEAVGEYITQFVGYTKVHKDKVFDVVKIGCGHAGFTEEQIKPFFKDAPANVNLPDGWRT